MKEMNNISKNEASEIDYLKEIDKDCMLSPETIEKVNKYMNDESATGVLSGEKEVEYFRRLNKKEEYSYCVVDDKGKITVNPLPEESKPKKMSGRDKGKSRVKPIPKDELDENGQQITEKEIKKREIKVTPSKLEQELKNNPHLKEREFIEQFNMDINKYSQAQIMKNVEWTTKYGKIGNTQISNTRTVSNSISRLPANTFGSIGKYDVDTLPDTLFKCKGTEVTEVRTDNYSGSGKHMLSRTFGSNILSYWCYILGIRYTPKTSDESEPSGINIWGRKVSYSGIDGKPKTEVFISGNELKIMIRDLIYLIRNNNPKDFFKNAKTGKISAFLYNTITTLRYANKTTTKEVIQQIKKRLYYTHQSGELCWAYPKYNVEYLIQLLRELNSGKYLCDILVPLVKDLHHYPIECKDTRVFPLTQQQHNRNADDYDLGKYIWERD